MLLLVLLLLLYSKREMRGGYALLCLVGRFGRSLIYASLLYGVTNLVDREYIDVVCVCGSMICDERGCNNRITGNPLHKQTTDIKRMPMYLYTPNAHD